MKRVFCDCCNNEIEHGAYPFNPLVHITEKPFAGYAVLDKDKNLHSVSGVEVKLDLCLPCYNDIFKAAYDKFLELKQNK